MINMLNIKEAILELHNEKHLIPKEDYDSLIQDAIDYINSDISIIPVEPIIVPPPTITLTVSDDILSYADNDSAVCTVTAVGETSDYSIKWYKNNSYLTTTTFTNNTTSYTYNSQGEGNVTIRAELTKNNNVISSQSDTIIDYILYDNAIIDNSSNYTKTSNLSITHDTDHYVLSTSANNQMLEIGSDYDNVRYEILMSGASHFARGLYYSDTENEYENNSLYNIYQTDNSNNRIQMADITNSNWTAIKQTSYTMTTNTYYRFIIEKIGTSVTLKVETEDGTPIETETVTKSLNSTHIGILMFSGTAYIKDIIIKPLSQFDVTTNKNILSYSDNDSSTLTAIYTHTDTTDYTVEWYNGSTLLGSSSFVGDTASYVYESTGIGDVEVTAKVVDTNDTVIITDSIVLEDCFVYMSNPSNSSGLNISLPSQAIVSFKMTKSGFVDGKSGSDILLGDDSNHNYFVGNWASAGNNGFLIRNNGSSTNLVAQTTSDIALNTEYTLGVTYNNGDWTYFKNDEIISFSANYTPTKLTRIDIGQQSTMSDLKVKPIPQFDVTTNKNILSYSDNDTSTLTATVDGSIYDSVVKWYNGNTLLSTSQLTSNTVTYTYNSSGGGDVTIRAELVRDNTTLSSDTVNLEDCQFYDNTLTDNTSHYDLTYNTGQSFTYDSTNNAYQVTRTSTGFGSILVDDLLVDNGTSLEISADLLLKTMATSSGGPNTQPRLIIVGGSNHTGIGADLSGYYAPQFEISIRELTVNSDVKILANQQYNMSTDTWYTMRMTYDNNSIIITLYDSQGTQLATSSSTYTVTGDYQCGIQMVHDTGASILFKNLKVKTIGE